MKRILRDQKGAVLVMVSLALAVLFGFTALAVDIGAAAAERRSLVTAADAAALAGAQYLPGDTGQAVAQAKAYARKNVRGLTDQDISVSFEEFNKRILVTVDREINTLFAGALKPEFRNMRVRAFAAAEQTGGFPPWALYSGSEAYDLRVTQNPRVTGATHTNHGFVNTSGGRFTGLLSHVGGFSGGSAAYEQGNRQSPVQPFPRVDVTQVLGVKYVWNEQAGTWDLVRNDQYPYYTPPSGELIVNTVDGGLYVDGDVRVTENGVSGTGFIVATGSIKIRGNNVGLGGSERVVFISLKENTGAPSQGNIDQSAISLRGDNTSFVGVIYAPNGRIALTGSGMKVKGAVLGDTIRYSNSTEIVYSSDFPHLFECGVRLVQ